MVLQRSSFDEIQTRRQRTKATSVSRKRPIYIYSDKNGTRLWLAKTAFPLLSNSATPPIRTIARETPADVDLNGKEDKRRYHATPPIEMRSRPTQATR